MKPPLSRLEWTAAKGRTHALLNWSEFGWVSEMPSPSRGGSLKRPNGQERQNGLRSGSRRQRSPKNTRRRRTDEVGSSPFGRAARQASTRRSIGRGGTGVGPKFQG